MNVTLATKTVDERFFEKFRVDEETGCWVWAGATKGGTPGGRYGAFYPDGRKGRRVYAHRFSYELLVGEIPDGLQIDHLCRNRLCVNPEHLEAVTPRENCLRGESPPAKSARRTRCVNGHRFTPENTYYRPDNNGRQCRTCRSERMRVWWEEHSR